MKKAFLFFAFVFLALTPLFQVKADTATSSLSIIDQLKGMLEEMKVIQNQITGEDKIITGEEQLKVLYPNGGESLTQGDMFTIKWDGTKSNAPKLNIYISTTSDPLAPQSANTLITANIPAETGFYKWQIPNDLAAATYKILVRGAGKYNKIKDYSDGAFSVVASAKAEHVFSLISPSDGEFLELGSMHKIRWTSLKGGRFVSFRLVSANTLTATSTEYKEYPFSFGNFESYADNTGSYDWNVTNVPVGEYRLRITSSYGPLKGPFYTDISTSTFSVVKDIEGKKNSIKVVYPNKVEDLKSGQKVNIKWTTPLDSDKIDIFVRGLPSGTDYPITYRYATGILDGKKEIEWTPNPFYGDDLKFVIKICRTANRVCDESDQQFYIFPELATSTEKMVQTMTPVIIGTTSTSTLFTLQATTTKQTTPVTHTDIENMKVLLTRVKILQDKMKTIPLSFLSSRMESETPPAKKIVKKEIDSSKARLPWNFDHRLSYGLVGDESVAALQEALTKEGLFSHDITGNFFDVTKTAVMDFQTKYGMEPTGSVGPGSQQKLNELYAEGSVNVTITTATSTQGVAEESCTSDAGNALSISEAKKIAVASECGTMQFDDYQSCRSTAGGIWWLGLKSTKANCVSTCIVNIDKKQANIQSTCTGSL